MCGFLFADACVGVSVKHGGCRKRTACIRIFSESSSRLRLCSPMYFRNAAVNRPPGVISFKSCRWQLTLSCQTFCTRNIQPLQVLFGSRHPPILPSTRHTISAAPPHPTVVAAPPTLHPHKSQTPASCLLSRSPPGRVLPMNVSSFASTSRAIVADAEP